MSQEGDRPDYEWQQLDVKNKYHQLHLIVSEVRNLSQEIVYKCWRSLPKSTGWRLKVLQSVRSRYLIPRGLIEHLDPRLVRGTGSTFLGLLKVFLERTIRSGKLPIRTNITPEKIELFPGDCSETEARVVKIAVSERGEVLVTLEEESEARK